MICASTVVLSTFSPASFFSSTPNSSMNAPLVPEPSSREITLICPEKSPPAALLSPSVLPSASVAEASFVVSAVKELLLSLLPHPASIPAAIIAVKVIAITFLFIIFFSPLFTRDFCDFYFVKSQSRRFLHFVFTGFIITTACKMQNLRDVKFM